MEGKSEMTDAIIAILRTERKLTAAQARLLAEQRRAVRVLGDRVRELNRWKDDFRNRKGRAA